MVVARDGNSNDRAADRTEAPGPVSRPLKYGRDAITFQKNPALKSRP
jgi:hypothetical protein